MHVQQSYQHEGEIRRVKTFTLEEETANPLERFMGRVLRGEVLQSLASFPLPEDRKWDFLVFGSSVIQLSRPEAGFPFRRRARDIDVTLINRSGSTTSMENISATDVQQAMTILLAAVARSGAAVVSESFHDLSGNKGFRLQRYFTADCIRSRLRGKLEEEYVEKVQLDLNVELEVESFCSRSHILPLRQFHNILCENLLETAGQKVARLLSPTEFVIRDLVDLYNLYRSGIVDVLAHRETLRVVALVWMGMKDLGTQFSRKNLFPAESEIQEYAAKLGVPTPTVQDILEVNRGVQEIIFPGEPDSPTRLLLRRNEEDFLFQLNGIERGEAAHERKFVQPHINTALLQQTNSAAFDTFPRLREMIAKESELVAKVRDAAQDQGFQTFGA
jgi:hypothetical protein